MPRFDKLEFGRRDKEPEAPSKPPSRERDETYWMELADDNRRNGLYENALRFYSRALEEDKSLVSGWLGQVQMLVLLDEFRQAETWSRTALDLYPSNGGLLAARAHAFCRMKDLQKAQELCDGALKQESQSSYGWQVRGEIMLATRQKTAEYCFDNAQRFDPDWLVSLEIARTYLYYRVPSKGLSWARRAVESAPDRYYAWYVQALCEHQLGFALRAQKSYQRCLELCPRHVEAKRQLAQLNQEGFSLGRVFRRLLGRS